MSFAAWLLKIIQGSLRSEADLPPPDIHKYNDGRDGLSAQCVVCAGRWAPAVASSVHGSSQGRRAVRLIPGSSAGQVPHSASVLPFLLVLPPSFFHSLSSLFLLPFSPDVWRQQLCEDWENKGRVLLILAEEASLVGAWQGISRWLSGCWVPAMVSQPVCPRALSELSQGIALRGGLTPASIPLLCGQIMPHVPGVRVRKPHE